MQKMLTKMFAGVAITTLLLASQVNAAVSVEPWDVSGSYTVGFQLTGDPTVYTHDMTLSQTAGQSMVTGSGGYPAGGPYTYHWNITSGSVSGNTINLTAVYDLGAPGTTMHMIGTIASDGTMSGTWDDNFGGTRTGTWATTTGSASRFIPVECDGMTFDNVVTGTSGPDTLNGTAGRDLIVGYGGADKLNGNSGDDCLSGGGGADTLNASSGSDVLVGAAGVDTLNGSTGDDKLYGDDGADTLNGDTGHDQLNGGGDQDNLNGSSGDDTMNGNGGDDTISGGTGIDTANGGAGAADNCNAETESNCEI